MKLVQQLLDRKGDEVISIVQDASVFDAIKLMADRGVGSLLVMEGDELKAAREKLVDGWLTTFIKGLGRLVATRRWPVLRRQQADRCRSQGIFS